MRCLASMLFVLLTLVLSSSGLGAATSEAGAECVCGEETHALADSDSSAEADAHGTCPPDCEDDCPCCGIATMAASAPGSCIRPATRSAVLSSARGIFGSPSGEHSGVYRPPRA